MEELLMQVMERFTERIISRQRAMYAIAGVPFIEKWRKAMRYIDEDLSAGYPKVWYELQAMAWNRPEFRKRVAHVHEQWHSVLLEAIDHAIAEYGLDRKQFPTDAVTALVQTFNEGILLDRLNGVDTGHKALLRWIDRWLRQLEKGRRR
jgi:hypothetical protein